MLNSRSKDPFLIALVDSKKVVKVSQSDKKKSNEVTESVINKGFCPSKYHHPYILTHVPLSSEFWSNYGVNYNNSRQSENHVISQPVNCSFLHKDGRYMQKSINDDRYVMYNIPEDLNDTKNYCILASSEHVIQHVCQCMNDYTIDKFFCIELFSSEKLFDAFNNLLVLIRKYGVDTISSDEFFVEIIFRFFVIQNLMYMLENFQYKSQSVIEEKFPVLCGNNKQDFIREKSIDLTNHYEKSTDEKDDDDIQTKICCVNSNDDAYNCNNQIQSESFCNDTLDLMSFPLTYDQCNESNLVLNNCYKMEEKDIDFENSDSLKESTKFIEILNPTSRNNHPQCCALALKSCVYNFVHPTFRKFNYFDIFFTDFFSNFDYSDFLNCSIAQCPCKATFIKHQLLRVKKKSKILDSDGEIDEYTSDAQQHQIMTTKVSKTELCNKNLSKSSIEKKHPKKRKGSRKLSLSRSFQERLFHRSSRSSDDFDENSASWISVEHEGDITIYYKTHKNSSFLSIMVEGIIKADILCIVSVLNEVELYKKWIPYYTFPFKLGLRECKRVQQLGRVDQVLSFKCDFPWPMLNRDAIIEVFCCDDFEKRQRIALKFLPCGDKAYNQRNRMNLPEPDEKTVRLIAEGGLILTLVERNMCHLKFICHLNPMVHLSQMILNFFLKVFVKSVFNSFRQACIDAEKEPYAACREKNRFLYSFIKQRLEEMNYG